MRNCFSSPKINKKMDYSTCDCECNCHSPEEMQLSDDDFIKNKKKSTKSYLSQSQIISKSKDSSDSDCDKILCTCKEICNCPCHCLSCCCCPCVTNKVENTDYYKNLYYQVKSELDIERKRNERIKYSKKVNENNTEKLKKEKEILLLENSSLKDTIDDLSNKLRKESKKKFF